MNFTNYLRQILPVVTLRPRPQEPAQADIRLVRRAAATASTLHDLPVDELHSRVRALRARVKNGLCVTSDEVVEQGFALAHEAARQCLGISFYDVQMLAARALLRGAIAEMATGEGKTFVQALAASVFALAGRGVHVMTSNAYLAERDYRQLSPILNRLGLRSGLLVSNAPPDQIRQAYQADITFGAGYEFGFDYLKDELARMHRRDRGLGESLQRQLRAGERATLPARQPASVDRGLPPSLQRGHAVAIVDEADSVMIDEATTPLLLSAPVEGAADTTRAFTLAAHVAGRLQRQEHFVIDEHQRTAKLTRQGVETVVRGEFFDESLPLERPWPVYIEQALAARYMLCRDVDYVVADEKIALVDQCTGRVFADRTWRQGLHQAVEAKESLLVSGPRRTLAQISRQQFFQLYDSLCGMTGTAATAERELWTIYRLAIIKIPTRKPCLRRIEPTRFFVSQAVKYAAIVEETIARYQARQPVLIGTRTIEESLRIERLLTAAEIPVQLLNGTQDAEEAEIIARAGLAGTVTIATNIAGRGTDIKLGPGSDQLGGLHVIASEPHTSSRVDRQLLGRAARQGDPGSCQMFASAEDELIRVFGRPLARTIRRLAAPSGEVREDLSNELARVQRRVEAMNFETRLQLLRSGAWMEDLLAKVAGASN